MMSKKTKDSGSPQRILMILQSDFPPDIRLRKEIQTLTRNGYHVCVICNNKGGSPGLEIYDRSFMIMRLSSFSAFGRRLRNVMQLPLFFSPVWIRAVHRAIGHFRPDILHVHDLPLMPLGLYAACHYHLPIVYDMHENYPEALKVWRQKGLIAFLFKNYRLARVIDRVSWRRADKIIVVVEEQKEYLTERGVPQEKIHVVSNTEDMESFQKFEIRRDVLDVFSGDDIILYIGTIAIDRGLEVPMKAMPSIVKRIPRAKLVIVGKGKYRDTLVSYAHQAGLTEYVKFIEWVDFDRVPSYITASKVCIVPQPSNPFIDRTVPHKLFQYMSLSKPVVVSDAKPLARIVRECNCGEVFTSNSAESFAAAIFRIFEGDRKYGERGRQAVLKKYNWNRSSRELLSLYQQIVDHERASVFRQI